MIRVPGRWEGSPATPDCSTTADDLAVFAQMLLNGGVGPNGRRVLAPDRAGHDRRRRDTPPASTGAGLGRANQLQFATRCALRQHQLRPYRLYRHQPLD